ncbi:MAG: adenylate/guanylate cyclase domain-containing protein [Endomicrobiia bacterium]
MTDLENVLKENINLKKRIELLEEELQDLKDINKTITIKLKDKESELTALQKSLSKEYKKEDSSSQRFNMVTVLFSNIRDMPKLSTDEKLHNLVDELDRFFIHFDNIVEKYNIKKIKTIGDTYMCAGGVPKKNRTNPIEVIRAALEVQDYMEHLEVLAQHTDKKIWKVSIGIHTGPAVISIIGKKNQSIDLKGDAANIASRIEASIEPGKVIISAMTYEFVKEFFECVYVGTLPVKYTGDIALFEVKGFKPTYSLEGNKIAPNKLFSIRFGFVRFDDLEDYILNRLENELPSYLYYHNVKHTMDVTIGVEIIGIAEGVTDEELLFLKTAALFHDMGQIVQSKGHEEISCDFAREILPSYGYSNDQIAVICSIIMATKLPPKPETLLQKIICDADLDYLGRADFIPVSDALYRELNEQNIITDKNEWNKLQIKFLTNHQYFTEFAQNNREVNKQTQIDRIKNLIID